ncbi:MAG: hypothetical protein JW759_01255 [Candidatus Coatesbacteria bacterium]|nr:hypothetical protein [Candidatus Coatesbacteria bacterium]
MRRLVVSVLLTAVLTCPVLSWAVMFETFTNTNMITRAILVDGPFIWTGTDGGLMRWCIEDGASEEFTTSNALVHNQVSSLARDLSSGVWAGTFGGASRLYNGMWASFDDAAGLASPRIEAVHVSSDGNVWFGTTGGVTVFNWQSFTNYTTQDGLADNWIRDIAEFAGSLYFATTNGLALFDGSEFRAITTDDGLPSNNISCLTAREDGLFVGTQGSGVCLFDGNGWQTYIGGEGIEGSIIADLSADPRGNVWAATELGISVYSGSGWQSFGRTDGLPDDQLLSVAADESGNVYVGTAKSGLWCWYRGNIIFLTSPQGVLDNRVQCVTTASDDSVWFGCEGGLSVLSAGQWRSHSQVAGKPLGTVNAIIEDLSGRLWFGTKDAGLVRLDGGEWTFFDAKDGLCDNTVHSLAILGDLVLAGTGAGLAAFDGVNFYALTQDNGLPFASVEAVAVSPTGRVIMGNRSAGGGIATFEGGQISHYTTADGLPSNNVYSINAESEDVVWLGTSLGAVRWDKEGMTTFDKGQGLAGFVVTAIGYGPYGCVWFGTTAGISRYDGDEFESFTQRNGLADNRAEGFCAGHEGDLWVATLGGVTRIRFTPEKQPQVAVSVSSPNYRPGESAVCSLSLSNPGEMRSLDVYFGLLTNTNALYCFVAEGRWLDADVRAWAESITIPAGANMTLDPFIAISLPSYYPPIVESGRYAFAAAICDTRTSEFIGGMSIATFELVRP